MEFSQFFFRRIFYFIALKIFGRGFQTRFSYQHLPQRVQIGIPTFLCVKESFSAAESATNTVK
jgi:hypothetical protein